MSFNHEMKPETITRRAAEFKMAKKRRVLDLYKRLMLRFDKEKTRDLEYADFMYKDAANEVKARHPEYF